MDLPQIPVLFDKGVNDPVGMRNSPKSDDGVFGMPSAPVNETQKMQGMLGIGA